MKDEVMVNYFTINNKDYIILNEIDYNNKHYVYLVNENDSKDILVKILKDNYLYSLESNEEFVAVLKQFIK